MWTWTPILNQVFYWSTQIRPLKSCLIFNCLTANCNHVKLSTTCIRLKVNIYHLHNIIITIIRWVRPPDWLNKSYRLILIYFLPLMKDIRRHMGANMIKNKKHFDDKHPVRPAAKQTYNFILMLKLIFHI